MIPKGNLLLSLKAGESVVVDGACTVTFVKMYGLGKGYERIQLAFEAERSVKIVRSELLAKGRES